MWSLFSAAHAYVLAPCHGVQVVDTVPDAGAVAVPVDARVAVVFGSGGPCADAAGTEVTLADASGTPVASTLGVGSDDPDATWLIELFPDEPLAPETDYVVTVLPAGVGEAAEIGFSTGSGTVAGLTGAPTFEVGDATWSRSGEGGALSVGLAITPADDPDGLSVMQARDVHVDRGVQTFRVPGSAPMEATARWFDSAKPAESCVQIRQIDGAGVATEWSEPQCATVPLCGTGGAAPSGALVATGALTALLRRRARA